MKLNEIIDWKNEKNKIDKVFDFDANFELVNKMIVNWNDVKNEIKKEIIKFETTNFDFFAWWSRICSWNLILFENLTEQRLQTNVFALIFSTFWRFFLDELFRFLDRFVVESFLFRNFVKILWHFQLFEHSNFELIVVRLDEFNRLVEFVLYEYHEFVRFANIICNKENDFDEFDKCVEKFWKQSFRTWNRWRNNRTKKKSKRYRNHDIRSRNKMLTKQNSWINKKINR